MATVTKPTRRRNVAEASRRVLDPLNRLRGYIRAYVSLEGAAVAVLYVAVCFWVGLLLDYGTFKLLGVDWVQEIPWWFRLAVLLALLSGLVVLVTSAVARRLFREFRDAALALLLERRFPKILGDRLITAVELSNPKKCAEQGYSRAMVEATIVEASECVERVPVREVFRWGRLYALGVAAVILTLVCYVVVGAGFGVVNRVFGGGTLLGGFGQLNEVAGLWFERNVLCQDTIWPRKAHLLFLEPTADELRIGRDVTPPAVRVRALKYVVADRGASEGWRPLRWQDFENNPKLLGAGVTPATPPSDWPVRDPGLGLTADEVDLFFAKYDFRKNADAPAWVINDTDGTRPLAWKDLSRDFLGIDVPKLPEAWTPRDAAVGLTVDEVAGEMAKSENGDAADLGDVRNVLAQLDRLADMRATLDRLQSRATDSAMRRTLRKLTVPAAVTVTVKGPTTSNTMTLTKLPDNDFTGQFGELKEKNPEGNWKFSYTARGEDYYTARRYITVVPPPTLTKLWREDARPAYLFYRPGHGVQEDHLRGKKQPMERVEVSLMSGDVVRLDVPGGTDLTLVGETTKPLRENGLRLLQVKGGAPLEQPFEMTDARTFRMTFPDVRQELQFFVEMTDTDGVVGKRQVKIHPVLDQEPAVDVSIADWVRKTKDGYMVTPVARLQFAGQVRDDNGLARVRYAYAVTRVDAAGPVDVNAILSSSVVPLLRHGGADNLLAAAYVLGALKESEKSKSAAEPKAEARYFPEAGSIRAFERALNDANARPTELLHVNAVDELLTQRQKLPFRTLLKDLRFDADPLKADRAENDPLFFDFPLWTAKLLAPEDKAQPRYRVLLWLEALDTDLDSTKEKDGVAGPHLAASKERFGLIVVSENELLSEIAKDEEKLHVDMDNVFGRLLESQSRLGTILSDLRSKDLKPQNIGPLSIGTEGLEQTLESTQASTKDVMAKYEAILRELKGNQVRQDMINRVAKDIIDPLQDIEQSEFPKARARVADLRKALDNADLPFDERVRLSEEAGGKARDQLQVLVDRLRGVLDKMQKLIDLNKLIKVLQELEKQEQIQYDRIRQIKEELERKLLGESLDPVKP